MRGNLEALYVTLTFSVCIKPSVNGHGEVGILNLVTSGIIMTNIPEVNSSQFSNNATYEGSHLHLTEKIGLIIRIAISVVTCPFTIVLNISVILAVKKTPRLQSKPNILLACLAATDAFIGITAQPSYILFAAFQVSGINSQAQSIRSHWHDRALVAGISNSLLHLMLVTLERLIAIKFTICYPYIITEKNIKISVVSFWTIALCTWGMGYMTHHVVLYTAGPLIACCLIFIAICYVILYRETLRHKERIKTEQVAQQEVEHFLKENKALKTTVYVVGSLALCFLPGFLVILSIKVDSLTLEKSDDIVGWSRLFTMLNSLLNPLIYFWRDKEMRKLVSNLFSRNSTVNTMD